MTQDYQSKEHFCIKIWGLFSNDFYGEVSVFVNQSAASFPLGFALDEMLTYWQWSWTRLLLKSRAGVGVIYFSRAGHPALQLPPQLLQGTRDSKEGFWSSAFKKGNGARLLLTILPVMNHVLSPASHRCVEAEVLRVSVLRKGHSETAVEVPSVSTWWPPAAQ